MSDSNEPESDDHKHRGYHRVGNVPAEAVLLINRQRRISANWGDLRAFLRKIDPVTSGASFSVCLVSDRTMRQFNKKFRRQDHTTDVLSFPAGGGKRRRYLGDIVISVETARDNAAQYGLTIEQEIQLLILHGVLHLVGYDHETDRGQMARAEKLWSTKLGIPASLTARSRASERARLTKERR